MIKYIRTNINTHIHMQLGKKNICTPLLHIKFCISWVHFPLYPYFYTHPHMPYTLLFHLCACVPACVVVCVVVCLCSNLAYGPAIELIFTCLLSFALPAAKQPTQQPYSANHKRSHKHFQNIHTYILTYKLCFSPSTFPFGLAHSYLAHFKQKGSDYVNEVLLKSHRYPVPGS